jgi:5,6,7,8-tetrahydromethanopterin hydro-lyase
MARRDPGMWIGEYFAGSGPNAAHINVIMGPKSGPVGAAFAGALANPTTGHIPFLVVAQPSMPVKPYTVFINKADLRGEPMHENATWGAAQAGIARGVFDAARKFPRGAAEAWVIIACVWVDWKVNDLDAVYENNRVAMREAIARAIRQQPSFSKVRKAAETPSNPFYTPAITR